MSAVGYRELLQWFWPEVVCGVGALMVLFVGVRLPAALTPSQRRRTLAFLGSVVLATASAFVAVLPDMGRLPDGLAVAEPGLAWMRGAVLVLALACLWLGDGGGDPEGGRHGAEFVSLMLLATVGLLLVTGSAHLLLIFLGLELASLSLYVLAGFDRDRPGAAEAALRYFLVGGLSAALMLYGISLLHGLAGTLDLASLGPRLSEAGGGVLPHIAIGCVLAGLGFKVAAAPFHLWVPAVYAAAPRPAAALVASGSKVAGFVVLFRILHVGLREFDGGAGWGSWSAGWMPAVALLSLTSMVVGNLTALVQTRLRRLLAWSAVAHAGYGLVALLGSGADARAAVGFYAITYAIALVGLFALVRVMERGGGDGLGRLAGWGRRSPWLAAALGVHLLSLAGVPPAAGFFGKYYAFTVALRPPVGAGHLWLVLAGLALSCVGIFYYLRVLHGMTCEPPPDPAECRRATPSEVVVIGACTALLLLLGMWPDLLLRWLLPATVF